MRLLTLLIGTALFAAADEWLAGRGLAPGFIALAPEDFIYPADRSARYTIIEISLFAGRSLETKKALVRTIFERFEKELGIAPQDVEITLQESPKENWGIRGKPGDELVLNYKVET